MNRKHAAWNRWNAYRRPTAEEIASGTKPDDFQWVGAEVEQRDAAQLLGDYGGGRIQFDKEGEMFDIDAWGQQTNPDS